MCGIFGWIKHDRSLTPREVTAAARATATLAHRGPDHQGQWHDARTFMGHRRLSILDLRPEANQPFHGPDDRLVLTYNGEIYNYQELRPGLQRTGWTFRTRSDTEVLLAAYARHGPAAFADFDGMYAVAVHDRLQHRHRLFRDPLGQKPLYWFDYGDGVIYASELRALLALGDFHWALDRDSFVKYLCNGYYAWDTTPLKGVRKLLPGCMLDIERGRCAVRRLWDSRPGDGTLDVDEVEAGERVLELLDRSCRTCLRSDVPYGLFLSGGIDSALLLHLCRRHDPDIAAFTVAMGERDFDEGAKARQVAEHVGARHMHAFLMDHDAVVQSVEDFGQFADEPHGDPGFVNAHFLARSCRPWITVGLSGDGGDELFGGYLPFLAARCAGPLAHVPGAARALHAAAGLLPGSDTYVGLQFKARALLQAFPCTPTTLFPLLIATMAPEALQRLCPWQPPAFFSRRGEPGTLLADFHQALAPMADHSTTQMGLYFYQKFFLPEFVCMHTDRAAMQTGMEVRAPMLSAPLIELANRLPDRLKVRGRVLKRLLRELARRQGFPESIWRQKKQGFTFPVARWLKGALHERMNALLAPGQWHSGLVDVDTLERLKREHLAGRRNHYRILFNLMVFRQWLDRFPMVRIEAERPWAVPLPRPAAPERAAA